MTDKIVITPKGRRISIPDEADGETVATLIDQADALPEPPKAQPTGARISSLSGLERPTTTLPSWATAGADASVDAMQPKDMIRGGQIALGVVPNPIQVSILGQALAQGALGAARGGAKTGAVDAAFGAAGPVVGKLVSLMRAPTLRMIADAWGQERPDVVAPAAERGLARLKLKNTAALEDEAMKTQTMSAPSTTTTKTAVDSPIVDVKGNAYPSEEVVVQHKPGEIQASPLQPTVDAHRSATAAARGSERSIAGAHSIPAAVARLVTSPTVRASLGQTAYSLASNNPAQFANALRLAILGLMEK